MAIEIVSRGGGIEACGTISGESGTIKWYDKKENLPKRRTVFEPLLFTPSIIGAVLAAMTPKNASTCHIKNSQKMRSGQ